MPSNKWSQKPGITLFQGIPGFLHRVTYSAKKRWSETKFIIGKEENMNFLNLVFYAFILVFFAVYFVVPNKYKYIVIFVGSYFFYGYSNPKILIVLIIASAISYVGGWMIHKSNYKKITYAIFFSMEIVMLGLFKYTDFLIKNINLILSKINSSFAVQPHFDFVMPIGLSFIVFQACTYLSDVYRKKMDIEKNVNVKPSA